MDTPEIPRTTISSFYRRASKAHQTSQMRKVMHEPLASLRRGKRAKRKEIREAVKAFKKDDAAIAEREEAEEKDDCEKEEVERKIEALQRIVPGGGDSTEVDNLFEKTAGYILALQCQVKTMRALTNFFEGLEKEKMKLGG